MRQNYETDPEVLADLALRESSTRDQRRTRTDALSGALPEPEVTHWPCRAARCGQLVGIPQSAVDALGTWNRELYRRGQPPIHEDTVALCSEHAAAAAADREQQQQARDARVAAAVRVLLLSATPRQEHAALRDLERDGHPDVAGLLDALQRKIEGTARSRRIRSEDL